MFLCVFFNKVRRRCNRQGRDTPSSSLNNMPSENDKKPVIASERKQKKRACNIEDQGSVQKRFLALQKEQIENQKAQEERQYNFFQTFLANREKKKGGLRNEIKIQACNLWGGKRPSCPK